MPADSSCFPGVDWETVSPASVGLDVRGLDLLRDQMQGRGCLVRHGKLVYTWGDAQARGDAFSAAKPVVAHFLLSALEQGRIASLDERAVTYEPRLADLNASLGYKDRFMTLRHMGNQVSCYGVAEWPGTAYNYNDWQMALLIDILFQRIYGLGYDHWDRSLLYPLLTDRLGCQDSPTLLNYGPDRAQGRLGISPRDFARFGLLYLNKGHWADEQVIGEKYARIALSEPVPNSIPRAGMEPAEVIKGQRTLGSERFPDNQTEHFGSYSWCWWLNGTDIDGVRYFTEAPTDTFCALGDTNGRRGMAVIPSLGVIISWNDTVLDTYPAQPHPLNACFRHLMAAIR
jgi:hypothetical protein